MMVLPWMVLPSQAMGFEGTTPLGAAHSTTLTFAVLSGAAKAELAGMTTLMLWPLENGVPLLTVPTGCAEPGTMSPVPGEALAGDENASAAKLPAAAVAAMETATRLATCRM